MPKKNKGEQAQQADSAPALTPLESTPAAAETTPPPAAAVVSGDAVDTGRVSQESKMLDDKLGALKDQITELRSSIKNFETELDARLDACFKSILAKKGAESGIV